jgi:hypothetical protein
MTSAIRGTTTGRGVPLHKSGETPRAEEKAKAKRAETARPHLAPRRSPVTVTSSCVRAVVYEDPSARSTTTRDGHGLENPQRDGAEANPEEHPRVVKAREKDGPSPLGRPPQVNLPDHPVATTSMASATKAKNAITGIRPPAGSTERGPVLTERPVLSCTKAPRDRQQRAGRLPQNGRRARKPIRRPRLCCSLYQTRRRIA